MKEEEKPKRRVAAYARVSTEQEEQQNSYEAQVAYYTQYINANPYWEFVAVYSDEGISGTSIKKRDGFNQMVEDALAGKIDLILTKSISRFSRNTVDSLSVTRDLKRAGVEVRFEKENLSSFDTSAEMVFTMFSSIAQEESRSISENVRWGKQRAMEDGKVTASLQNFLGYKKAADGSWVIVEEEAKTVREIYDLFLSGLPVRCIARELTARGIKSPGGKDKWGTQTVNSILSNEKYIGDVILGKTYVEDFLTKRVKKNNGERAMYRVTDHHPPIIDRDVFDLVQKEKEFRAANSRRLSSNSPFTTKIVCADCGTFFGHKIRRDKDIWYCNHKYKNDERCNTPTILEDSLKAFYEEAMGLELARITAQKAPRRLSEAEEASLAARLVSAREKAREAQSAAMADFRLHYQGTTGDGSSDFIDRYNNALKKIEDLEAAFNLAKDALLDNTARREKERRFYEAIAPLTPDTVTYDDSLFVATIERIVVSAMNGEKYTLEYYFKNGDRVKLTKNTK